VLDRIAINKNSIDKELDSKRSIGYITEIKKQIIVDHNSRIKNTSSIDEELISNIVKIRSPNIAMSKDNIIVDNNILSRVVIPDSSPILDRNPSININSNTEDISINELYLNIDRRTNIDRSTNRTGPSRVISHINKDRKSSKEMSERVVFVENDKDDIVCLKYLFEGCSFRNCRYSHRRPNSSDSFSIRNYQSKYPYKKQIVF
jgi:hypothetical protein